MRTDAYGQIVYTEDDLCDLLLTDTNININGALTDKKIKISNELDLKNVPFLIEWKDSDLSIEEFDKTQQENWHMPEQYKNLDIVQYLIDKCTTEEQLQRVASELLLYLERNMFSLLRYLVYLVDTMRQNNIVWGVGRGSSVSSYVLYLIGVHKIDSIYYELQIEDFLK